MIILINQWFKSFTILFLILGYMHNPAVCLPFDGADVDIFQALQNKTVYQSIK